MNWNWDQLRFFLALAENNTLTEAASVLAVSHSTVLRRIKNFEKQLDTHLFEQRPDGYILTTAGQQLFEECTQIRQRIRAVSEQIAGSDHELAGEVVITTTDTLAQYVLPTELQAIQANYPNLQFTLQMLNQLSNLNNREADIAIRTCLTPPDDLIGRKVGDLHFSVVASKKYLCEHPIDSFPAGNQSHNFICLDSNYASTPFYNWFKQRVSDPLLCTTVSNFISATAMARAGMGFTVLPSYVLNHEPELTSIPVDSPIPHNELWLLSHINLRNTDRVKLVKDLLYQSIRKSLMP